MCRCHILKAAGSEGNVGPNLDTVNVTIDLVVEMVTYNKESTVYGEEEILTKEEIEIVSYYVVNVAGRDNIIILIMEDKIKKDYSLQLLKD